jgi:sterol 24-C-methyltransferase
MGRLFPLLSILQGRGFPPGSTFTFRSRSRSPTDDQLARQEHYLAAQINIRPGMKVLDVGCGVGGPAREIARFTDATIIGVNNNDFQIDRATKKTAKAGLSDKVSFQKGDFMKLSETFGENSFDASE